MTLPPHLDAVHDRLVLLRQRIEQKAEGKPHQQWATDNALGDVDRLVAALRDSDRIEQFRRIANTTTNEDVATTAMTSIPDLIGPTLIDRND
ncbi:hypothetical protein ACT17_32800 [Mycolicibacterium conceptionense]|uniref:Uncharacterized protein n=1 Tax=Mycolicibacterium conceptionense TaxID=451644 RepID=A0A0J8TXR9_9MYCO|nr:hypothetical protein [Mycolicibacterium conceptionense]KMV13962.1 hypothetical protein ACT17_32800 [Mycolicibacterium conceptionense]